MIGSTAGQWCFALLAEARGMPAAAGVWASLFWSSLCVGRLALGFVAERVGPNRMRGWERWARSRAR